MIPIFVPNPDFNEVAMKKTPVAIALLLLLATCQMAQAGGRRRAWRSSAQSACRPTVSYQQPVTNLAPPVYSSAQTSQVQPTSYPQPQPMVYAVASAPLPPQTAAPTEAQPNYTYDVAQGQPAYYYTYDSSGKLIIQQWMDWLFRGGRDAGMPRPPLPIIGRLAGR